ncbi:pilus assembly protein PilZ [Bacillus sp. HMF5848]|nr:pilus assembly protein PilZ [Bacillus sp. HMF5848]
MAKIGTTFTLEPKYGNEIEVLKCKLVEQKGNYLYIDYPINIKTRRTALLIDGTQIKVSFVIESTVYSFDTEVLGRVRQRNIPMLILSYPGDDQLVKIQRREYVRVETAADVAVHSLNDEFKPFVTVTTDVSAGGAALIVPKKVNLEANMKVITWFVLPMESGEYNYLRIYAKIIRIVPGKQGEADRAPIEFIDLEERDRQHIIRYCFDRQLAYRNRTRM